MLSGGVDSVPRNMFVQVPPQLIIVKEDQARLGFGTLLLKIGCRDPFCCAWSANESMAQGSVEEVCSKIGYFIE